MKQTLEPKALYTLSAIADLAGVHKSTARRAAARLDVAPRRVIGANDVAVFDAVDALEIMAGAREHLDRPTQSLTAIMDAVNA